MSNLEEDSDILTRRPDLAEAFGVKPAQDDIASRRPDLAEAFGVSKPATPTPTASALDRQFPGVQERVDSSTLTQEELRSAFLPMESEPQATSEKQKDFFRAGDTISAIWDSVRGLGDTAPAAFYQMVEGLENPDKYSEAAKRAFAEADAWNRELQTKTEANRAAGTSSSVSESIREGGQSLAFSGVSLAAQIPAKILGKLAGRPIGAAVGGAVTANPAGVAAGSLAGGEILGEAAGMAAGGAAAYRMAGAMFLNESFKKLEEKSVATQGRPLTPEEKADYYEKLLPIARDTGLWEAGPEAVGNAISLRGLGAVLGIGGAKKLASGTVAKGIGKKVAEKAAAAAGALGGELTTETITQVGQKADEAKADAIVEGRSTEGISTDWSGPAVAEAFKEVYPQTLGLMGLTIGAGGVVKAGSTALSKKPVKPDPVEVVASTLTQQAAPFAPESAAASEEATRDLVADAAPLSPQSVAAANETPVTGEEAPVDVNETPVRETQTDLSLTNETQIPPVTERNPAQVKMVVRILARQGVDPETAAELAGDIIDDVGETDNAEEFREKAVAAFRARGGVMPNENTTYSEDASTYEAAGDTPEEAAQKVENAKAFNTLQRSQADETNRGLVGQKRPTTKTGAPPSPPKAAAPSTKTIYEMDDDELLTKQAEYQQIANQNAVEATDEGGPGTARDLAETASRVLTATNAEIEKRKQSGNFKPTNEPTSQTPVPQAPEEDIPEGVPEAGVQPTSSEPVVGGEEGGVATLENQYSEAFNNPDTSKDELKVLREKRNSARLNLVESKGFKPGVNLRISPDKVVSIEAITEGGLIQTTDGVFSPSDSTISASNEAPTPPKKEIPTSEKAVEDLTDDDIRGVLYSDKVKPSQLQKGDKVFSTFKGVGTVLKVSKNSARIEYRDSQGITEADYKQTEDAYRIPDNVASRLINPSQAETPAPSKPDAETSNPTPLAASTAEEGVGKPVTRDPSKPEQMSPEEFEGHDLAREKYVEEMSKMDAKGVSPPPREFMLKAATTVAHRESITSALELKSPVSAEAVDTYGIKLPDGYVSEGELYVYRGKETTDSLSRPENVTAYHPEKLPPMSDGEWAKQSAVDKAETIGLNARLLAHPKFPALKDSVDKAWGKINKGEEFETTPYLQFAYLDTHMGGQKALQDKIAKDLGVGFHENAKSLFGGRHVDIPNPTPGGPQAYAEQVGKFAGEGLSADEREKAQVEAAAAALGIKETAQGTPLPYSVESLKTAFSLTDEQAVVADAIGKALGAKVDLVAKGGVPGSGALAQGENAADPFYSQLSRAIEAKMPKSLPPQGVISMLGEYIVTKKEGEKTSVVGKFPFNEKAKADALAASVPEGKAAWNSTHQIRDEEVKWSGLEQALGSLAVDGKVSKDAVLKYLADEGAVKFEEVTLSDTLPELEWRQRGNSLEARSGKFLAFIEKRPNGKFMLEVGSAKSWHSTVESAQEEAVTRHKLYGRSGTPAATKFSQYTLPGGENYREVVLAMPKKNADLKARQMEATKRGDYEEASRIQEQINATGETGADTYTSSHFSDVPNYVAHMRTNERDGGLFIEELQSDRHQAGRKQGYRADQARLDELMSKDLLTQAESDEMGDQYGKVADAPFRTTWPLTLFKRALRDAVASGSLAWNDATKPESIGKLSDDLLGGKYPLRSSLGPVEAGVIRLAGKHDQVRRAVIAAIPVNVVRDLTNHKLTPEQLFGGSDVVWNTLPVDRRSDVADGIRDALVKTATNLRAALNSVLSGGRDQEVLPTLKASVLTPSEVVGLLSPFGSANFIPVQRGVESVATSGGAKLGGELAGDVSSAELANLLNRHAAIIQGRPVDSIQIFKPSFSWLGWTSGDTQNDRFDLSKHLDEIGYNEGAAGGRVVGFKNGQVVIEHTGVTPEKLPDYIGKDAADKLMAQPVASKMDTRKLSGVDLKVGGSGMKGFYDNMLPKEIGKYVKQWGGKVEKAEIDAKGYYVDPDMGDFYVREPVERDAVQVFNSEQEAQEWIDKQPRTPIWRIDITPEMRKSILESGQPLFQDAKASFEITETGKILLRGLQNPDFTSAVHEIAHAARRSMDSVLDEKEVRTVEQWAGVKQGKWNRYSEEKWARAWERYFREGKAPQQRLQAIFDKIAGWMTEVYRTIAGSPIDVEITPEVRAIMDKLAGRMEVPDTLTDTPAPEEVADLESRFPSTPDHVRTPAGSLYTTDGSPVPPAISELPENLDQLPPVEQMDAVAGYLRGKMEESSAVPPAPEIPDATNWNPEGLFSLQERASMDEAARFGLETDWKQARRNFGQLWQSAVEAEAAYTGNRSAGSDLLDNLVATKGLTRPLTDRQIALLTHEGLRRKMVVQRTLNDLAQATKSGDPEAMSAAETAHRDALAEFQALQNVAAGARTESGRSLNAWKYALRDDFSYATLFTRSLAGLNAARRRQGLDPLQELPASEQAAIKAYAEKQQTRLNLLEAAKSELEAANTEQATKLAEQQALIESLREEMKAAGKRRAVRESAKKVIVDRVSRAAAEARERLAAAKEINIEGEPTILYQAANSEIDPLWNDRVLVMAEDLVKEPGMSDARFAELVKLRFGSSVAAGASDLRKATQEHLRETMEDLTGEHVATSEEIMSEVGSKEAVTREVVIDLARFHIYDGARNSEVIDRVHETIAEEFPTITREEVAQLFTRYGEMDPKTPDELDKALQTAKSIELVQKQIDNLLASGEMKRTGRPKQEVEIKLREKRKERDDLAKKLGYTPVDPETQLSSPQTAAKKRMLNEIEELKAAIEGGNRRVRVRRGVEYTEDMKELRAELEALRDTYEKTFGQERTPAEIDALLLKDLDRRIAKEESLIARGLLAEPDSGKPEHIASPEVMARRQKLADLRQQKRDAYERANPGETALKQAMAAAHKAVQKRLDVLSGNESPKVKKERGEGVTASDDLKRLWKAADAMTDYIKEIRKARPLTPAQHQKKLDDAYNDALETREVLRRRIKLGDIIPSKDTRTVEDRTRIVREENAALRKQITQMQKDAQLGIYDPIFRQDRREKSMTKRLNEVKRMRREKDYDKKPRTEPATNEKIRQLEQDIYLEKHAYETERAKHVFDSLGAVGQVKTYLLALYNARMLFNLTGDLGPIDRQLGKTNIFLASRDLKDLWKQYRAGEKVRLSETRIVDTAKKAYRSFLNETNHVALHREMVTDPMYPYYKKMGFDLLNPHDTSHELNSEGVVRLNPMTAISDRAIGIIMLARGGLKGLVAASTMGVYGSVLEGVRQAVLGAAIAIGGRKLAVRVERANTTILNVARWHILEAALQLQGQVDPMVAPDYAKNVTIGIMNLTGKIAGTSEVTKSLKNNTYILGHFLSFPQYRWTNLMSVFLGPLARIGFGMRFEVGPEVKKGIPLGKYGKLYLGKNDANAQAAKALSTVYGYWMAGWALKITVMSALLGTWDDKEDEETWGFGVVINPANPNFGTLKVGKTYIDFASGARTWLTDIAAMMYPKTVDYEKARDGVIEMVPSTPHSRTEAFDSWLNKLVNPNLRTMKDFFIRRQFRKGGELDRMSWTNKFDALSDEVLMNLTINEAARIYKEHGPVEGSKIFSLLMLGDNVNIRETNKERNDRLLEEAKKYEKR